MSLNIVVQKLTNTEMMLGAAMQYAKDPVAWMRQAAVYGIRIAAENAQAQFSPKASAALNVLAAVVTAPDSRTTTIAMLLKTLSPPLVQYVNFMPMHRCQCP